MTAHNTFNDTVAYATYRMNEEFISKLAFYHF